MNFFVIMMFVGVTMIPFFCDKIIYFQNKGENNIMNSNDHHAVHNNHEIFMRVEPTYTVEGTITEIIFGNISKTSRVEKLMMYLDLEMADSNHDVLKFRKYPVFKSDKQLSVGQRVSITARKLKKEFGEYSEYLEIVSIEPL